MRCSIQRWKSLFNPIHHWFYRLSHHQIGAVYPFITAAKGSYKIKAAQGCIGSVFS